MNLFFDSVKKKNDSLIGCIIDLDSSEVRSFNVVYI